MKLKIEYVFVIVVLLCLTLPSIFINTKKDVVSDIDNRKLVELPDFDEENYFEKFETALSDRIGFRSSLLSEHCSEYISTTETSRKHGQRHLQVTGCIRAVSELVSTTSTHNSVRNTQRSTSMRWPFSAMLLVYSRKR